MVRRAPGKLAIVGPLITDPAELAAIGVSPGEGAIEVDEQLYRAAYAALGEHQP